MILVPLVNISFLSTWALYIQGYSCLLEICKIIPIWRETLPIKRKTAYFKGISTNFEGTLPILRVNYQFWGKTTNFEGTLPILREHYQFWGLTTNFEGRQPILRENYQFWGKLPCEGHQPKSVNLEEFLGLLGGKIYQFLPNLSNQTH